MIGNEVPAKRCRSQRMKYEAGSPRVIVSPTVGPDHARWAPWHSKRRLRAPRARAEIRAPVQ